MGDFSFKLTEECISPEEEDYIIDATNPDNCEPMRLVSGETEDKDPYTLDSLPFEIIGTILSYCQIEDHFRFKSTSKRWNIALADSLYTKSAKFNSKIFNSELKEFLVKCLRYLDVSNQRISDSDVDIIIQMKKLKNLNLQGTKPKKILENIGNFPRLKDLNLSSCSLNSSHIELLDPISHSLRFLDISENELGIDEVQLLSRFSNLEYLNMSYCSDIDYKCIKAIHMMRHLKKLHIANCFGICNRAMKYIGEMTNLEELNTRGCPIDHSGFKHLKNLKNLEVLNICGSNLTCTASTLTLLKPFTKMRQLYFNGRFSDEDFGLLQHMKDLSNIKVEGYLSLESLNILASFDRMRDIEVHDCLSLTSENIGIFSNYNDLNSLSLEGCSLLDQGSLSFLKQYRYLKSISINGCPFLTDHDASYIGSLHQLEYISMQDTGISDLGVSTWGELTNIKTLLLGNQPIMYGPKSLVTSNVLKYLLKLKGLKRLKLSNFERNQNHTWEYISNFSNLTTLELIGCGINEDDIPLFESLVHLEKFDISLNESINPLAFQNMIQIETLNYIYVENTELWTRSELRALLSWQDDEERGAGGEQEPNEQGENEGGEEEE